MFLECVDQDETEPSNMSCRLSLDGDHSEISRDRMPAHRVAGNSNWSMCDRVVPSVFDHEVHIKQVRGSPADDVL